MNDVPIKNATIINQPFIIEKGGNWVMEDDSIHFIKSGMGTGKGELIKSLIE
jgi:hypothetical protein